jgi:hypothetical protein
MRTNKRLGSELHLIPANDHSALMIIRYVPHSAALRTFCPPRPSGAHFPVSAKSMISDNYGVLAPCINHPHCVVFNGD